MRLITEASKLIYHVVWLIKLLAFESWFWTQHLAKNQGTESQSTKCTYISPRI
jgi:hypothetical protein